MSDFHDLAKECQVAIAGGRGFEERWGMSFFPRDSGDTVHDLHENLADSQLRFQSRKRKRLEVTVFGWSVLGGISKLKGEGIMAISQTPAALVQPSRAGQRTGMAD